MNHFFSYNSSKKNELLMMEAQHRRSNFPLTRIRTSEKTISKLETFIAYTESATATTKTKQFRKHIYCRFTK